MMASPDRLMTMNELQPSPVSAPIAEPEPQEPPELSISDHAKAYGPESSTPDPEAPDSETQTEKAERLHMSALQKRDKTGAFSPGKPRIKAKDAVGRINELTGRAKTAEERATALEKELHTLRSGPATSPAARPAAPSADSTRPAAPPSPRLPHGMLAPQPEPDENDPKFGGDYGKYMRAVSRWESREALREHQQDVFRALQQRHVQSQNDSATKLLGERIDAAKGRYPDFEQVAFAPTRITEGGAIDAFIIEDDNGPDVLYHLQRNPQEMESLLKMEHDVRRGGNAIKLLRTLALLSQRFDSTPQGQAGTTGSAPPRIVNLPPRPPNPVRTEAQRAGDSPAPTDGSLSIAAHAKAFGPQRR